jgi:hypothetical protein
MGEPGFRVLFRLETASLESGSGHDPCFDNTAAEWAVLSM